MWLSEVRGYGTLTGRAWQQEGEVAGTAPVVGRSWSVGTGSTSSALSLSPGPRPWNGESSPLLTFHRRAGA